MGLDPSILYCHVIIFTFLFQKCFKIKCNQNHNISDKLDVDVWHKDFL